jgi:hypothetical protein
MPTASRQSPQDTDRTMDYLQALRQTHAALRPRSYVEIGCRHGRSLVLADCPAVGIDPEFELKVELPAATRLFEMTSDDFFAAQDPRDVLGVPIDFAFIDGMHLAEYALRDFINLERNAHRGAVVAIDDVLPQEMAHASRERTTRIWTGDVYRLISVLQHYRPDLDIRVYDVDMKGFCVISGLDPDSGVLRDHLPDIERALAAGQWVATSVQEIRATQRPAPVEWLAPDLERLARRGEQLAMAQGADAASARPYLDLLKRSLLNEIYLDDELRIFYLRSCIAGEDSFDAQVLHDIRNQRRDDYRQLEESRRIGKFFRKIRNSGFNHSMMGRLRLQNLHDCLDRIREEALAGDLVECGVWRGGGCIFMAGYLRTHGMLDLRVIVADSFEGLPVPSLPQDANLDLSRQVYPQLAVALDTVRENFSVYGLLGPNVEFLRGWFKDTLPTAKVDRIALLRMDGDLYESTMDILLNLYDKVVPGGIVIVDDYNAIAVCRQALTDFFAARAQPVPPVHPIDWTGVWFRKP